MNKKCVNCEWLEFFNGCHICGYVAEVYHIKKEVNPDEVCQINRKDKKMKIYIAGAITNNPNYAEQFATAERKLTSEGHVVINPVKNLGFDYKDYIDMGLCELMHCEAIFLLKGWENSEGANLEHHYALTTGLKVIEE